MPDLNVINDQGNVFVVPDTELENAQKRGFRVATDEELAKYDRLKEFSGARGEALATAGSYLNQFTLGAAEPIMEKFFPNAAEQVKTAQEANPLASVTGGAGGVVGSLFTPVVKGIGLAGEGVLQGAEKLAPVIGKGASRILGRTAQMGVESLLASAPKAAAEAVTGDTEEAAETLLAAGKIGAGLGLTTGVGEQFFKLIKPVVGKVGELIGDKVEEVLRNQKLKALGSQKSIQKKLTEKQIQEVIDVAEETGVLGTVQSIFKTPTTKKAEAQKLLQEAGAIKSQIIQELDSLGQELVDREGLVASLQGIKKEIPKQMAYNQDRAVAKQALKEFDDISKVTTTQVINGQKIKVVQDKPITLQNLEDLRLKWAQKAKYHIQNTLSDSQRSLYRSLERTLDGFMDAAVESADTLQPGRWMESQRKYRAFKAMMPMLQNLVNLGSNQAISVSDMAASVVGGQLGGPAGAVKGWILNELRQQYGAPAAAMGLEAGINATKAVSDKISSVSNRIISSKAAPRVRAASLGVLSRLTGEKDREKATDAFVTNLSQITTNPNLAQERLSQSVTNLSQIDNNIALKAQDKLMEASQMLLALAPKKQVGSPFESSVGNYTDSEMADFERSVAAVLDPMSVLDEVADGTVSPQAVDIIQRLYPKLYGRIQTELLNKASEKPRDYSYDKKLNLSMFFGSSVDSMAQPEKIMMLQQNYLRGESKKSPRLSGQRQQQNNYLSEGQRIENR